MWVKIWLIGSLWMMMADHPFHVSVCRITHNPRSSRIELVQDVFLNDLEQALRKRLQEPKFDITKSQNTARLDSLMVVYYTEHVQLQVNRKPQTLIYLGHENKKGKIWSYLETRKKIRRKPNHIHIRNSILMGHFADQQNMIRIRIGQTEKSLLLTKNAQQQEAQF